jgi:HEPN domain-containing protein
MLSDEDKYQYWLTYATNDIETAASMVAAGRWVYVFFTCQQALEKIAKGLYVLYIDDNVPRLHDISLIVRRFADKLPEPINNEYFMLFDNLSTFYLKSRYPDYARELAQAANEPPQGKPCGILSVA